MIQRITDSFAVIFYNGLLDFDVERIQNNIKQTQRQFYICYEFNPRNYLHTIYRFVLQVAAFFPPRPETI